MMRKNISFDTLLKYIHGKTTPDERQQIEKWLESDASHREFYERAIYYFLHFYSESRPVRSNDHSAWLYFERRVRRRRMIHLLKYAALFVLPLMLSGYLFIKYANRETQSVVISQHIEPGASKAILITEWGDQIELQSSEQRLKECYGAHLDSSGICYQNNTVSKKKYQHNEMHTVIVPRGAEYRVTLSDGSRIYLNAESKLSYPIHFNDTVRKLTLSGEAYFEVVSDKKRPFRVITSLGEVTVLGTKFNLSAYDSDRLAIATLLEGKIAFTADALSMPRLLNVGDQLSYDKFTGKWNQKKVNAARFADWIHGKLTFEGETFEEIAIRLERWYNVTICFENERIKHMVFTGDLQRYKSCEDVLDLLCLTTRLDYTVDERTITLYIKQ